MPNTKTNKVQWPAASTKTSKTETLLMQTPFTAFALLLLGMVLGVLLMLAITWPTVPSWWGTPLPQLWQQMQQPQPSPRQPDDKLDKDTVLQDVAQHQLPTMSLDAIAATLTAAGFSVTQRGSHYLRFNAADFSLDLRLLEDGSLYLQHRFLPPAPVEISLVNDWNQQRRASVATLLDNGELILNTSRLAQQGLAPNSLIGVVELFYRNSLPTFVQQVDQHLAQL